MRYANLQSLKNESERGQLIASIQQFIRMYNPHEAREDTVLFPAFRKIVSPHEFDALGEDFEKKEDELSAKTDLRKWSIRLQESNNDWAFTTSPSLHRRCKGHARTFRYRCACGDCCCANYGR